MDQKKEGNKRDFQSYTENAEEDRNVKIPRSHYGAGNEEDDPSNRTSNGIAEKQHAQTPPSNKYLTTAVRRLDKTFPIKSPHGKVEKPVDTPLTHANNEQSNLAPPAPTEPKQSPLRALAHHSQVNNQELPKETPTSLNAVPPLPPLAPGTLSTAPFTHSSTHDSKYTSDITHLNYERLEFLGDSYVELCATRFIYARFPHLLVGRQNLLREKLTSNAALASFAKRYEFDKRINGARNLEQQTTETVWMKVMADVFEAFVAAVALSDVEGGLGVLEAWLTALWAPMVLELQQPGTEVDLVGTGTNFKDLLHSKVGGKEVEVKYVDVGKMFYSADRSVQRFRVGCRITGWGFEGELVATAVGQSKKEAHMNAARQALQSPAVKTMIERKGEYDAQRKRERAERVKREEATANEETSRKS